MVTGVADAYGRKTVNPRQGIETVLRALAARIAALSVGRQ